MKHVYEKKHEFLHRGAKKASLGASVISGCRTEVPKVSKVVAPQGEGHFLKDPSFFFIYGYFLWFLKP